MTRKNPPEIGSWLRADQVARKLGVKPRTVTDMVVRNLLHPTKYQRPGKSGAPISLFDPTEVAALVEQRAADRTQVMPAGAAPQVLPPLNPRALIGDGAAGAAALIDAQRRESLRKDKYLTLEEASLLTKLSQAEIHRHLKDVARRGAHNLNVYPREAVEEL